MLIFICLKQYCLKDNKFIKNFSHKTKTSIYPSVSFCRFWEGLSKSGGPVQRDVSMPTSQLFNVACLGNLNLNLNEHFNNHSVSCCFQISNECPLYLTLVHLNDFTCNHNIIHSMNGFILFKCWWQLSIPRPFKICMLNPRNVTRLERFYFRLQVCTTHLKLQAHLSRSIPKFYTSSRIISSICPLPCHGVLRCRLITSPATTNRCI